MRVGSCGNNKEDIKDYAFKLLTFRNDLKAVV